MVLDVLNQIDGEAGRRDHKGGFGAFCGNRAVAVEVFEAMRKQQLIGRVSSQYDINATDLETRLMAVIDYISGMTDVYALDVYQKINGISLPIV